MAKSLQQTSWAIRGDSVKLASWVASASSPNGSAQFIVLQLERVPSAVSSSNIYDAGIAHQTRQRINANRIGMMTSETRTVRMADRKFSIASC
jgi:hypothetical protein